MGSGRWTADKFRTYSASVGRKVNEKGALDGDYSAQEMFRSRHLAPELNPKNVMRECVDSKEHPATIPVLLGLDVTGSMGPASVEVAKKLNIVMTKLYGVVQDVEFAVMAIGDLAYDDAPIQLSQFESDIRVAEQLDKVYFEGGGGGNMFESYTAAWYMAVNHTKLDCIKRGKKGLIITMGDEPLNPYLPARPLKSVTGDGLQADVETAALYAEASKSFNLYHLFVRHDNARWADTSKKTFGQFLDDEHYREVTVDTISDAIVDIVKRHESGNSQTEARAHGTGISW